MGEYLIYMAGIYAIIGLLNYGQVANRIDKLFDGHMALDMKGMFLCIFVWPWSYFFYKDLEKDFER